MEASPQNPENKLPQNSKPLQKAIPLILGIRQFHSGSSLHYATKTRSIIWSGSLLISSPLIYRLNLHHPKCSPQYCHRSIPHLPYHQSSCSHFATATILRIVSQTTLFLSPANRQCNSSPPWQTHRARWYLSRNHHRENLIKQLSVMCPLTAPTVQPGQLYNPFWTYLSIPPLAQDLRLRWVVFSF